MTGLHRSPARCRSKEEAGANAAGARCRYRRGIPKPSASTGGIAVGHGWRPRFDLLGTTLFHPRHRNPITIHSANRAGPFRCPAQMADAPVPTASSWIAVREHFMAWLRQASRRASSSSTTPRSGAYRRRYDLPGQPGVFQRYAQETSESPRWPSRTKWRVAVGAEALREAGTAPQAAERAGTSDLRSHGPRKSRRLHGYLLVSPDALFQETPPDNPYLRPQRGRKARRSALGARTTIRRIGMRPLCRPASTSADGADSASLASVRSSSGRNCISAHGRS